MVPAYKAAKYPLILVSDSGIRSRLKALKYQQNILLCKISMILCVQELGDVVSQPSDDERFHSI